jgi:hypothetical protein
MTTVMDTFMELFIELDLLSTTELSSFYWYWDFITSSKGHALKTLREMSSSLKTQLYEIDLATAKDNVSLTKIALSGNKKNKKLKEAHADAKTTYARHLETPVPTPMAYSSEEMYVILKGQLQKALFRVYLGLDQGGVIKPTVSPYAPPDLLFANRYRSFLAITNPSPIGYADFMATKNSSTPEQLGQLWGYFVHKCVQ